MSNRRWQSLSVEVVVLLLMLMTLPCWSLLRGPNTKNRRIPSPRHRNLMSDQGPVDTYSPTVAPTFATPVPTVTPSVDPTFVPTDSPTSDRSLSPSTAMPFTESPTQATPSPSVLLSPTTPLPSLSVTTLSPTTRTPTLTPTTTPKPPAPTTISTLVPTRVEPLSFPVPLENFTITFVGALDSVEALSASTSQFLFQQMQDLQYLTKVTLDPFAITQRWLQSSSSTTHSSSIQYGGTAVFGDLPVPDQDTFFSSQEAALANTAGLQAAIDENSAIGDVTVEEAVITGEQIPPESNSGGGGSGKAGMIAGITAGAAVAIVVFLAYRHFQSVPPPPPLPPKENDENDDDDDDSQGDDNGQSLEDGSLNSDMDAFSLSAESQHSDREDVKRDLLLKHALYQHKAPPPRGTKEPMNSATAAAIAVAPMSGGARRASFDPESERSSSDFSDTTTDFSYDNIGYSKRSSLLNQIDTDTDDAADSLFFDEVTTDEEVSDVTPAKPRGMRVVTPDIVSDNSMSQSRAMSPASATLNQIPSNDSDRWRRPLQSDDANSEVPFDEMTEQEDLTDFSEPGRLLRTLPSDELRSMQKRSETAQALANEVQYGRSIRPTRAVSFRSSPSEKSKSSPVKNETQSGGATGADDGSSDGESSGGEDPNSLSDFLRERKKAKRAARKTRESRKQPPISMEV